MDGSLSAGRLPGVRPFGARAQRFPLEMEIRLHGIGSAEWTRGRTLNVSRSGLLFRTSDLTVDPGAEVELTLAMSGLGPRLADITCRARVVRCEPDADGGLLVGARIVMYEMVPAGSAVRHL